MIFNLLVFHRAESVTIIALVFLNIPFLLLVCGIHIMLSHDRLDVQNFSVTMFQIWLFM